MARRSPRPRRPQGRARPVVFIAGLLALALSGVALFWLQTPLPRVAAGPDAPGRLIATEATIDLGRVPFDRMVEAGFTVANIGGETVRLVGVPRVQMLEGC